MSADANLDYARVRRRTAPEAKWLVNELAALRGRLDKVRERTAALRKKEVVLEKKIEALELVAAKVRLPEGTTPPFTIRPWERYGKRGSLNKLLLDTLEAAYPDSVSTNHFVERVTKETRFSLDFSLQDLRLIRQSVLRRLKHLRDAGKLERAGQQGTEANGVAVWRLVKRTDVSLERLQGLAQAAQERDVAEEGV